VGGGVQLGPLGTAATGRPIVPAPDDYDDGEIGGMIGKGNRSTRRNPASVPLCPPQTPHPCPDANPDRRGGNPAISGSTLATPRGGPGCSRPGRDVEFVVDKAALRQVFSEYFDFPCQSFHPFLHHHKHPGLAQ
jgi:hypothetical protein